MIFCNALSTNCDIFRNGFLGEVQHNNLGQNYRVCHFQVFTPSISIGLRAQGIVQPKRPCNCTLLIIDVGGVPAHSHVHI